VAVVNWMIASVVTGVAVVLIEPIAGLDPVTTSLLVVPALGAALLGGLRSFWITLGAGLGIGALQSLILGIAVENSSAVPDWLPTPGLQQAVPVVLILGALMWRGDALPGRAAVLERRLPTAPSPRRPAVWAVVGVLAVGTGLLTFDALHRQALVTSMIYALLALSVVVVTGFVGQISLVQVSFAGVAGFTVIVAAQDGLPFPLAALVACAVATAVGVVVGLPAARVRGMSLGVATLAVAVAIEQLVLASTSFTGGALGERAPRPSLFGLDIGYFAPGDDNFRPAMGFVVLAALVGCCLGVANLRRNPTGLRWLAVRSNERAAAAMGIDVARAKLGAFAVSSFLAGLCGVFMAVTTTTLSMTSFPVIGSLVVLALTYLGGISSIGGALVAGLLAQGGLLTALTSGSDAQSGSSVQAMAGIALIAAAILTPDGLTGLARRLGSAVHTHWRARPSASSGPTASDASLGGGRQSHEDAPAAPPDDVVPQVGVAP
jgi:ABC-type branched-subunit amino acid transport system permease subunit